MLAQKMGTSKFQALNHRRIEGCFSWSSEDFSGFPSDFRSPKPGSSCYKHSPALMPQALTARKKEKRVEEDFLMEKKKLSALEDTITS